MENKYGNTKYNSYTKYNVYEEKNGGNKKYTNMVIQNIIVIHKYNVYKRCKNIHKYIIQNKK